MIAQSFIATQALQHLQSGEIGFVYRVGLSPYYAEEAAGVERIQVSVQIPSASGALFAAFDYWLAEECVVLPCEPIPAGSTVQLIDIHGAVEVATVLATGYNEVCALLPDGLISWVHIRHVAASLLTSSAA